MRKVGTPKSWKTKAVKTDGFVFGQADLTGEALYCPGKGKLEQVETQGKDDAV